MIVEPSTTWASSERPLYAATVRVVRLLAAAIDHRVSPGVTTCGTAAAAGAADARKAKAEMRMLRRTGDLRGLDWGASASIAAFPVRHTPARALTEPCSGRCRPRAELRRAARVVAR